MGYRETAGRISLISPDLTEEKFLLDMVRKYPYSKAVNQ